jgi:hypothetical protein
VSKVGVFDAKAFQNRIADWDWKHAGRPVLSNQHFGGELHGERGSVEANLLALQAVFPRVKILIMIREQADALVSAYIKYLRKGGQQGLTQYLSRPGALAIFDYGTQVERLHRIFGSDAVLVFPMERLVQNRHLFLEQLAAFAEAEIPQARLLALPHANVSTMYLARRFTRFLPQDRSATLPTLFSRGARGMVGRATPAWMERRHRVHQKARVKRWLADHFAPGNQKAADLLGMDLSPLGYKMQR